MFTGAYSTKVQKTTSSSVLAHWHNTPTLDLLPSVETHKGKARCVSTTVILGRLPIITGEELTDRIGALTKLEAYLDNS